MTFSRRPTSHVLRGFYRSSLGYNSASKFANKALIEHQFVGLVRYLRL